MVSRRLVVAIWHFLRLAFAPIKALEEWHGVLGLILSSLLVCGAVAGTGLVAWQVPLPSESYTKIQEDGAKEVVTVYAPRWPYFVGLPSLALATLFLIAGVRSQRAKGQRDLIPNASDDTLNILEGI